MLMTDKDYFYTIVLYPIVFTIYMCINIFFSFVFSLSFNVPYQELLYSSVWEVIEGGVSLLFFFVWFISIGSKRHTVKRRISCGEYLILLISVICIVVVVAISQGFMKGDELVFLQLKGTFALSITAICFMLIAGLRGISYLKSKDALYKAEKALYNQYLEKQEEHIKDVIEADKRLRSFRHDINAHLCALESCIDEKDYDELQKYIDRMKEETRNKKTNCYSGYAAVDAIIAEWYEKAKRANIVWEWNGVLNEKLSIELFDLCILFSNLLSNAVEAAEKVEKDNDRFVKTVVGSFRGRTTIIISNSCNKETMSIKEFNTSKADKDNHGFGLKNIHRMVDKYDGNIAITCDNNIFEVDITI